MAVYTIIQFNLMCFSWKIDKHSWPMTMNIRNELQSIKFFILCGLWFHWKNKISNAMAKSRQKPSKIQIFQLIQKYLANIGICPSLAKQPYPINGKIITGSATLILYVICSLIYLFYESKTFTERTRTVYMCSVAALVLFALLIFILNVTKIFQFIDDCEAIVNTSECRSSFFSFISMWNWLFSHEKMLF